MFKNLKIREIFGTSKQLKELTDSEIENIICNNEKESAGVLSCVCAEYLKRLIEKQKKSE